MSQQVFEIDDFLSGWFLGADPAAIKRGNLQEFVSYAFFNQVCNWWAATAVCPSVRCSRIGGQLRGSLQQFVSYAFFNQVGPLELGIGLARD